MTLVLLIGLNMMELRAQPPIPDWSRLQHGEVIVESVESENGVPGVRSRFSIQASREKIWQALVDYDNFSRIFQGIRKMKVLDSSSQGAIVEFWVDAVLADLHYVLRREYSMPGYQLTWKKVSGDLKDIQGHWQILDTPDPRKKLLIYDSYVDIGFPLATWAVLFGAQKKPGRCRIDCGYGSKVRNRLYIGCV